MRSASAMFQGLSPVFWLENNAHVPSPTFVSRLIREIPSSTTAVCTGEKPGAADSGSDEAPPPPDEAPPDAPAEKPAEAPAAKPAEKPAKKPAGKKTKKGGSR